MMRYGDIKVEKKSYSEKSLNDGARIEIKVGNETFVFLVHPDNKVGLDYSLQFGENLVLLNILKNGDYFVPDKLKGERVNGNKVQNIFNNLEKIVKKSK